MAKFYKSGTFGLMVEAEGGASDPELAEVRMTAEEYRNIWSQMRQAEREVEYAKANAQKRVSEAWEQADRDSEAAVRKAEEEAQRKIDAKQQEVDAIRNAAVVLKGQLDKAKEELKNEKNLHKNLLRIMRERANQARGIKPKKEHDGYIVLESRQWVEKYTEETWDTEEHKKIFNNTAKRKDAIRNGYLRIEHKTANVWKSVIQTPYDASLPIRQIRDRVEDDDLWNGGILDDIGCTGMCENKDNGTYMDFGKTDEGYDINGLYKWLFKANYRTGLWEMEIFTTKSLRVPEHRRPPRRMKEQCPGRKKAAGAEALPADGPSLDYIWFSDHSEDG